jgi:hypothetical protein
MENEKESKLSVAVRNKGLIYYYKILSFNTKDNPTAMRTFR